MNHKLCDANVARAHEYQGMGQMYYHHIFISTVIATDQ